MTHLDTGTDDLLAQVDDGVAVLTMNRPHRRNAMSQAMMAAMDRILCQLEVFLSKRHGIFHLMYLGLPFRLLSPPCL